jgi:hypothetical protein
MLAESADLGLGSVALGTMEDSLLGEVKDTCQQQQGRPIRRSRRRERECGSSPLKKGYMENSTTATENKVDTFQGSQLLYGIKQS